MNWVGRATYPQATYLPMAHLPYRFANSSHINCGLDNPHASRRAWTLPTCASEPNLLSARNLAVALLRVRAVALVGASRQGPLSSAPKRWLVA